jgi:plasmid maintenance system killer protein
MERTKKESLLERYWRLRGEADELYQRRIREIKISEEMRKSIQRELDALEDAIEKADLAQVLRHKLILEILLE